MYYLILTISFAALFGWCLLGVASVVSIIYGLILERQDRKSQSSE